jgi:hypothetical protein
MISLALFGAASAETPKPAWEPVRTVALKGFKVGLSQPALVARRKGYLWFPTLSRLDNGDLLALMSDYADMHVKKATARAAFSRDGGLTWGETKPILYGDVNFALPGGDQLLLPYYLYPRERGMGAACQIIRKGKQEPSDHGEVLFTGWPRPDRSFEPKLGLSGFVTNGQVAHIKGGYLCTLYGYFKDCKRYALVAAESSDGLEWKIRSTIADENCKLRGSEGPCESALARLKDGRLLCVFRMQSGLPYGHCFSSDDGKTWSEPAAMPADVFSVQPSLAVLPDGAVVLSGGRPGLFLWLSADGTAKTWQRIDILAHHNAVVPPADTIKTAGNTSAYTDVIALGPTELVMIYDRIPHSWAAIPKDSPETNSVWVVHVRLQKTKE